MSRYKEVFEEIDKTKDKRKIANLLNTLLEIKPNIEYISHLTDLTNKVSDIKFSAINILSKFNSDTLEDFFISKIKEESNKMIVCRLIRGLNLNGKEKSLEFLIAFHKQTRSIDIKSEIIQTLRIIYTRNEISDKNIENIKKLIGNDYPFFQGYWTKLNKTKIIVKKNLEIESKAQLNKNNLNLLFQENEKYDIHISIEKMKKDYIRYINVYCIFKNHKSSFSKFYTPSEFYLSEGIQFTNFLEGTKTMRPDQYANEILSTINNQLLPKLFKRIEITEKLKELSYQGFLKEENEIYESLFGTNTDFIVSHLLTSRFDIFRTNPDKASYANLIIEKWNNTNKVSFAIIDYLNEQKTTGNNV